MKQDIKLSLTLHKILYSFAFIFLLALIRGISSISEIGLVVDVNMSFLAVIFCADTYYQEFQGGRWEIFSLLPAKNRVYAIRRRLLIQYIYLIFLSTVCYIFFYMQRPYLEEGVNEIRLYGIAIGAVGASIVFFGGLSVTLVNLTKNLWSGMGISIVLWLSLSSSTSYKLPLPVQIFAFARRNLIPGEDDFLWIQGKITASCLGIFFVVLQSVLLRKGKR